MIRNLRSIAIASLMLAATLSASPAGAAQVDVKARSYTYSCGYYSSAETDLRITYRNRQLPWGVIVELIHGYQGFRYAWTDSNWQRAPFEWRQEDRRVVSSSGPYEWSTTVTIPRAQRSRADFYTGLDFVFRVIYPDGTISFDNGGESPWGFYVADTGPAQPACVDGSHDLPEFEALDLEKVERW